MLKTSEAPRTRKPSVPATPASALAGVNQTGYLGPAQVMEINERDRLMLVQWQRAGQPCLSWARPALVTPSPLKPGDVALVLSQNLEDFYLIGLLNATDAAPAPLQTASGARVAVTQSDGEEVVQVHSKQGALVVQYHPASGKAVVNVEEGDLEFVTQNGNIAFQSAKDISFVAQRLETQAETVVSEAKNSYETVEELSQLQAGRMRTVVEESCHLKARNTFLKAEEDFKVDGKQIHLG